MKSFSVLLLLIALINSGCSNTKPVDGKVSFSDGSPLGKGVLTLSNDKLGSFRSMINSDGTFKLDGIPPGDYKVIITGAQEGGTVETEMKYDAQGNYIPPPPSPPPKLLIKEDYTSLEKTPLTLKVPGDYQLKVEKP